MVSSSQIRERLSLFLDGQIDLEAFEDWFVQNTWNIHLSGSVAAESLTFAIEESLSEYSSEHLSLKELRDELSQILDADNKVMQIAYVPKVVWSVRPSVPAILAAAML